MADVHMSLILHMEVKKPNNLPKRKQASISFVKQHNVT